MKQLASETDDDKQETLETGRLRMPRHPQWMRKCDMPVRVAHKVNSSKKSINPFGWFNLKRYQDLSLTSLQWYQQIALRQALFMYISPDLLASEAAEPDSTSVAPPPVIEKALLAQATSAWKKLKRQPVSADLQLLHGDLADRLSGASSTGNLLKGVRNLTYADMATAGFFCRELRLRGVKRKEFDAYSANPMEAANYRQWMSEAIGTGLANKQFFGMLTVDLEHPDRYIRQEFDRWLTDARQRWRDAWKRGGTGDPTWMDDLVMSGKHEYNLESFAQTGLLPCMDLLISASENQVRLTSMELANFLGLENPARDQTVRSGVQKRAFGLLARAEDGLRVMRWLEEQIASEIAQHGSTTVDFGKD